MNQPLFPHQEEGAIRIAQGRPTYLGFDMGIGKSRTFIDATLRLTKPPRVLILCPSTALHVWRSEIDKWAHGAPAAVATKPAHLNGRQRFTIVTHGMLSQRHGELAEALKTCPPFDFTALDEAHAFNSADSLRVKALRAASPNLGQIVPLSGTPMRNHAGDLYTLLALCWPQGLKTSQGHVVSRYDFEERFCQVAMRKFGNARFPVRVIEGSKNLMQLRRMMAPFMFRVRKEEVLKDLPPISWDRVQVPVTPDIMAADSDYERKLARVLGMDDEAVLSQLRRADTDAHLMTLRRLLGVAKLRGACEYLVDMLDNLPEDRKVLVFAVHKEVIAQLKTHLAEYNPAVIVGDTSDKDRGSEIDKFLSDPTCRVFIGNLQAAGTAVTLVGPACQCSDVVFVESAWTPADNAQAACRVHRIGQKDGVVARMLSAVGTIDDLIADILVRKAREFSQLFDVQPGGSSEDHV